MSMAAQNWKAVYAMERGPLGREEPEDVSRGISQTLYAAWCIANGSNVGDVRQASETTIEQIYFTQYWQPYGPVLPGGIDAEWFDMTVLYGPVVATQTLQRALGQEPDGHLGLETMQAAHTANRIEIIGKITASRLETAKDPDWIKWVEAVNEVALALT